MQRKYYFYPTIRSSFPLAAILLLSAGAVRAQPGRDSPSVTERKVRLVADSVLRSATFRFVDEKTGASYVSPSDAPADAQLRPESPYNDWRYWNGVLNIAMLRLGEQLHDTSYTNFVNRSIAFDFDSYKYFDDRYHGEDKWTYPLGQMIVMKELDDCGAMGASLIEIYWHDQQARYRAYIDSAAGHIMNSQARLADGTLVRSFPIKWTLWADDLYMSVSFLARLGVMRRNMCYLMDAAQQVINFNEHLFDEKKGLMYHCWYSDTRTNGVAFWGRANGWMLMAQVDLLDRLPMFYRRRQSLIPLLRRQIEGLVRYQDASGLWHQLLDRPDSYLETSCSAMFTYAIARAVNMGYIDSSYASVARRGWEGVMSKIRPDGKIEGVCTGTGVGDNLNFYYNRPTPLNDVHGIGAVILAGTEILNLTK